MKTSSLTSIVAACLSAGGAMAGYIFLKPSSLEKYLEWQGLKLASITEDNLWKSIYDENKDNFNSDFSATDTEQWKVIKDYCTKAFKKTDYSSDIEKATKWCVDNVRTVRGQLIRKGNNVDDLMMSTTEQYQTSTVVQGNEDFWKLIGAKGDTTKDRSEAYKAWCETSLKEKPKEDLVGNVDRFCRKKPYSNFKDKLIYDGYTRLTVAEIKKKYDDLNLEKLTKYTGSNWLEAIGGGAANWIRNLGVQKDNWKVERSKFEEHYKKYCDERDDKRLFDEDNYPNKYSEFRSLCAKPTNIDK